MQEANHIHPDGVRDDCDSRENQDQLECGLQKEGDDCCTDQDSDNKKQFGLSDPSEQRQH